MRETIDCAVVGASGYAGAELVGLLAAHPRARLVSIHADHSQGQRFEDLHPAKRHLHRGVLQGFDPAHLAGLDAVFLALPHGQSARAAAALHGRVGRILDLSGDLRAPDAPAYRSWYGAEHAAPELLGQAVYGLPELFGDDLPDARLVACAGCYATVAQLAATPALALAAGAAATGVVVSAVSGTTGAGRKGELELSFSEVSDDLRAYRVGRHPHAPEIAQGLLRATGHAAPVTFVPHLGPFARGIFATVVVPNPDRRDQAEVLAAYRAAYAGRPFVRVVDPASRLPRVRDVAFTNFCDLAPIVDAAAGTIVVLGVLDNLLKGAAGQAVQALNLACGFPETAGLPASVEEVATHV